MGSASPPDCQASACARLESRWCSGPALFVDPFARADRPLDIDRASFLRYCPQTSARRPKKLIGATW